MRHAGQRARLTVLQRLERHRVALARLLLVAVVALSRGAGEPPVPRPVAGRAPAEATAPDGSPWRGAVAVDGDTLVAPDGRRLRLPGIDCPETGRPGAEEARRLSQAFVDACGPDGPRLVPAAPGRDAYGRLLADLRSQDGSLSARLVEAGLAWVYRRPDAELRRAQRRAVASRRGVHVLLDRPAADGPYLLTGTSFHRPSCGTVRARQGRLPVAARADGPLADGLAPCRRCLAWPPAAPLGAPAVRGPDSTGERARRAR